MRTVVALSPTPLAALRYWNVARQRYTRRLARNGKPCASLATQPPSQPRTPARKAGVLDARKWLRERDGLSAGGEWIRKFSSALDRQRFRGFVRGDSAGAASSTSVTVPEFARLFAGGKWIRTCSTRPRCIPLSPPLCRPVASRAAAYVGRRAIAESSAVVTGFPPDLRTKPVYRI